MKKHIALFTLSAAALMGLSACSGNGGDTKSSSAEPVSSSEVTPSEESSIESSEIDLSVALTIDAPEGVEVDIDDAPVDGKYHAGDEVSFTVTATDTYPSNKVINGVTVNGHSVVADSTGAYYFVMGKNGATIKVSEKTIGDIAIESIKDVDTTAIPTLAKADYADTEKVTAFVKSIADIVKAGDATHEKLLRGGEFSISNSPISGYELSDTVGYSGSINSGRGSIYATGDKIKVEISATTGNGNHTFKYSVENGYADEDQTLYYKRNTSWGAQSSYYDHGAKADPDNLFVYHVVSDEAETVDTKTMIKASEAKSHSTSFALGTVFASQCFSDAYTAGIAKTSSDKFTREIKDVKTTVADDGKSYSMDIVAFDLSNLDGAQFFKYVYSFTVDGDGFVSRLAVHKYKYTNKDYWDSENDTLTADAKADSDSFTDFTLYRGYKYDESLVETTDVSSYKMNDYDIQICAQNDWSGTFYTSLSDVAEGDTLTFEVGTTIKSFAYRDYTSGNAVLLPTFKGAKDDGFITETVSYSTTTYSIDKVGETALLFDNWFGDIKEVPVKFVTPGPHGIDATLSASTVVLGDSITLTASVTPASASQEYTVTLAENDPTESTLKKNEDGTYTITPAKVGNSSVIITSSVDTSVTKTVNFAVAGPATLDGVKSLLPTVTFVNGSADKNKLGWDTININFNADGTGSAVAYYGSNSYGNPSFTWTIDETSLEIAITPASDADGITLSKLTPVNSASFQLTFTRSGTEYTIDVYTADRVADLSKGPWAAAID